jgi:xylulokinase
MFLGLDLGTTNVKALVVDRGGRVVASGSAAVSRHCRPDGSVEQDIEQIWGATCQAVRQAASSVDAAAIEAVGVSSQGGALQLLDGEDRPLGPVISWLDSRGRPFDEQLVRELGEEFFAAHAGCHTCLMTPGQVLRLRARSPETMAKTAAIGYVGDMIVHRLCGRRAHDATSLSIALLYNPSLGRADPELLERLGLREDQLPDLVAADEPAGSLRADAAAATGLPAGIPVSPAVHDQYAASLGSGSVHEGDVSLGTGTAWAMIANSTGLTRPATREAILCQHPVPGLFGQLLSMVNGGSAIEWAMRLSGSSQVACEEVDAMLQTAGPGSDGLCFWPLLAPTLGPKAAAFQGGRIDGLRFSHGPSHLVRAAVEGLACELARHLDLLAEAGCPVLRLVMCGAAATSRTTPQIAADVPGRPATCAGEPAISAFGAAVLARAMVEKDTGLARLAEQLAPASRTFVPGENAATYGRLLERYLTALC